MLTTAESPEAVSQHQGTRRPGLGPILVATDGTESAEPALRAASVLSRHTGADVVALAVLEGLPLVAADYGILIPPLDTPVERRDALTRRVRAQLLTLGSSADWTVEVREGDAAATIARSARECDARLIIVGIGHHDLVDRLFGGETALHALRMARTPVLAVPPGFDRMPSRVAVATDFTVASVTAARKALELFESGAVLGVAIPNFAGGFGDESRTVRRPAR